MPVPRPGPTKRARVPAISALSPSFTRSFRSPGENLTHFHESTNKQIQGNNSRLQRFRILSQTALPATSTPSIYPYWSITRRTMTTNPRQRMQPSSSFDSLWTRIVAGVMNRKKSTAPSCADGLTHGLSLTAYGLTLVYPYPKGGDPWTSSRRSVRFATLENCEP